MIRIVISSSARARLEAARQFVLDAAPAAETLVLSATRGAADDFVRQLALAQGATFGLYRFSLTQFAARLAGPRLSEDRRAPATALGIEAVAARAAYEADHEGVLTYFAPVATSPGFPRALARTLEELSLAAVRPADLDGAGGGAVDLAELLARFEAQCDAVSTVDRAGFLAAATRAAHERSGPYAACRLLLLDVSLTNASERAFVRALVGRASDALATVPDGDTLTEGALAPLGVVERIDPAGSGLDRVRRGLFAAGTVAVGEPIEDVELFSAPGEAREAVEIARRILREARSGVPFDGMAIALRAPQQYAGLLEHALERAGIPAYFERGSRRPHAAGRAFLSLVACAQENLSARRFAEYLSLGQVPRPAAGPAGPDIVPASRDDVFGPLADRADQQAHAADESVAAEPSPRAFRAPWKWERLLVESRVVASSERWERRLRGLLRECELQRAALERTEPESARIDHLLRKTDDLKALDAFALPIMRTLADWPFETTWTEWIDLFEALAPRVLSRPERVLRVLADLRPMGAIGPISLDEAARVLSTRLNTIETEPPPRRYGRVFVGGPAQLRGRTFEVVFVPALAERLFPQRPREDPLLLDAARIRLNAGLLVQAERAALEKQQLRLAVGAAERKLYVSFPTVEVGEGRPRVPSLYALEVWRAMTGRVPSADELQQAAARASQATLAWPAPADPANAIDALEHDLATLRTLIDQPDSRARGRAHYILQLNESLRRSVNERHMRARQAWGRWDGIAQVTDRTRPILSGYRLTNPARVYSLSALQRYATCPYQFLLGAIYRLRPAEDLEPLQRMDPLTRGSLFHAVQTEFYRRLQGRAQLPVRPGDLSEALEVLDDCLKEVADREHEQLAPAIERVWSDEVAAMRRDLRLWVDQIAHADDGWVPIRFEWAFGLKGGGPLAEGRDPDSRLDPVTVDGRFKLHGSIDLIEEHETTKALRVTDHKTGRYRGKEHMMIGGGRTLQPVLYSMALEAALERPVAQGRLYYATTDGGFKDVIIPIVEVSRKAGLEALDIIDRAIASGCLPPAPDDGVCTWCDFRPVCGANAERRSRLKSPELMADLQALRRKP